ncbi:MAG: HNH endonuclease [Agriterribacter sp.]
MKFKEIFFDLDDKNLFAVDDLKLKADAIRHSILPRLEIISNHTIGLINQVYSHNALELSTILKFPNFRKTRSKDFSIDYLSSEAGLGAKRNASLWTSMKRKDGKQPMIIPFSLTFCLDKHGLNFYFSTSRYSLTMDDYSTFYNFHRNYSQEIYNLINESKVTISKDLIDYRRFLFKPLDDYLAYQKLEGWQLLMQSKTYKYPIINKEIETLIEDFVTFYPIYDSYLKLASSSKQSIKKHIGKLKEWLIERKYKEFEDEELVTNKEAYNYEKSKLLKIAETKIKVMPALRWQIFQRDNWKYVACGRNSENGIILHIDHIIPRSKGGLDHIDNYQTLCDICNIGKGNRDQTDLRTKSKKVDKHFKFIK